MHRVFSQRYRIKRVTLDPQKKGAQLNRQNDRSFT